MVFSESQLTLPRLTLDRARKLLTPRKEEAAEIETPISDPQTLAQTEHQAIHAALARHAGNRTATAGELGISRRKLHYWLNKNAGSEV